MANNLAAVMPILVAQGLQVLRSQCVMPRLVNGDYSNVPAERGDTINVWIPSAASVYDVAPSAAPFQADDSAPVKAPVQLTQWRHSGFYMNDKQIGDVVAGLKPKQMDACIAALANDVNAFIFSQYKAFYGFVGTPGTTPFATDVTGATLSRAQLNRQLAPLQDRRLVLDVNAEANALALAQFAQVQMVGTDKAVIEGTIGRRYGFDVAMDQQTPTHASTVLTAGAATVNGVNAINAGTTDGGRTGTVSIAKATNTSPLVKGDIITIAGDAQTYVVTANTTLAIGNTTVPIAPALQKATAGGEAVSLKATHVVNLAFHRDAISFASRPLQSAQANSQEMYSIADPVSGIALRLEVVRQNKQLLFDFDILFGASTVRPELGARLAG